MYDVSKLGRFAYHRDVLGHVLFILWSAAPAIDPTHQILNGACPFDQNVLFPRRML